jgi:GNAT superfamily N-acetyltransferase
MDILYKNSITVEEANHIRKSVGFRQNHPEELQNSLNGSNFIVAAYKGDAAIGMARLLWDGGGVAIVLDLLVIPEYVTQGIEQELIAQIFQFLRGKLKPGFGIQVDIRAWGKQEALFESLGFQVSAPKRRGVPMHICLTDQIELTDRMFHQMGF